MWSGSAAVVPVIVVTESQLEHLTHVLQDSQCLVDCRRTCGGELPLDLLV